MSYEGSKDEEKLKTVPIISKNKNIILILILTVTPISKMTTKKSTKTSMTKLKWPSKPLSAPKWFKQKNYKLHTMTLPTKSSNKHCKKNAIKIFNRSSHVVQ